MKNLKKFWKIVKESIWFNLVEVVKEILKKVLLKNGVD